MPATEADYERIGNFAVIYERDRNIDRHQCKRETQMEVLVLSLHRTGTLSLQSALRKLGYPNPYHFSELYANVRDCDMWMEAFRAKYEGIGTFEREQWDQLLGHCGAVTDWPASVFALELAAAYPDAKIILTERDIDKWLVSVDGLFQAVTDKVFGCITSLDYQYIARVNQVGFACCKYVYGATTLSGLRNNARSAYEQHYRRIREAIPKERILEYELGSGWGPICEFLEKPIPDEPFPHLNEAKSVTDAFQSQTKYVLGRVVANVVFWASVVIVPIAAGLYWGGK